MNCEDEIILLSGELQDAMAVQYQAMIMCKIVLDILGGQKVDLIWKMGFHLLQEKIATCRQDLQEQQIWFQ